MKYAILASGSSGNASLVWTERHCLVVEAGIPMRKLTAAKSIARCVLKPDAILVSHEHDDHAGYAAEASRYWHCPVLCSRETAPRFQKPHDVPWDLRTFAVGQGFTLPEWDLRIQTVAVPHVQGAVGFVITEGWEGGESNGQPKNSGSYAVEGDASSKTRSIAIFTDLGSVTDEIRAAIAQVHLLAIEADYSVGMMAENPEYP